MVYIPIKYKINKKSYTIIKTPTRMARDKTSWRKRLEASLEIKRWNYAQSTGVLTRSALRNLLFNNS